MSAMITSFATLTARVARKNPKNQQLWRPGAPQKATIDPRASVVQEKSRESEGRLYTRP
jgi:hypothetical protein